MRRPGPYAQGLLVKLLFQAQFVRANIVAFLNAQAMPQIAGQLPPAAGDYADVTNAVRLLCTHGQMTEELLDALEAQPQLTPYAATFDRIRIAMELAPPVDTLLSLPELDRVKVSAREGRLHRGLEHARLKARLPAEVMRRASVAIADEGDQMEAWFDAANRQLVGPGDDVHMLQLLDTSIEVAAQPGKDALAAVRNRIRATVLGVDLGSYPQDDGGALEQVVQEFGIAVNAAQFFERGGTALSRICLIRIGATDTGTGFLVGDDLVLTNHHVMSRVIGGMRSADTVRCVFDYRSSAAGSKHGPEVRLKTDGATDANPQPWLVDASPPTDGEVQGTAEAIANATSTDHLDFALLRLAESVGTSDGPNGAPRGHFEMAPAGPLFPFSQGTALTIVGHPSAPGGGRCDPQVFAIEPDSVIALNPNRTRVQYRTNTLKGSSGSPVLSTNWRLVALHHFGKQDQFNQGIPISIIASRAPVQAALA